ncbi:MAG: UDP-4-amino-4,6-dideoxy-N-acetyl-beta-L-altrosamine N-acetyltransferase [Cyclobacteriaceae bacterium]|jgi:UDP-4-amino-4,6-dideoxy-N-acetyl-beta-L-altrosamine N-acetyltransferase
MDIQLIKLSLDDIELVRYWRNSPDVASYMYNEKEISSSGQLEWFNRINEESSKYWVISYNGKKLGLASVTGIDYTLQSCYWAFYLGDSSVRGAGIGAKVEYNVLEYVFNELGLNKLRCEVFVENDKVIKMHEKFGFRREAYYREHCVKGSNKLDVVGLALLKSEWARLKSTQKSAIYGE